MANAWKTGCVTINGKTICGDAMVDAVLQSCFDVGNDWVCPTAVGTKSTG